MRVNLDEIARTSNDDEVAIIENEFVAYYFSREGDPCPHCGCVWYVDPGSELGSSFLCGWKDGDEYPCTRSEG